MSARRKLARAQAKRAATAVPFEEQQVTITLANPVASQFAGFVIDNALTLEAQMHDTLIAANHDAALALEPYIGIAGVLEAVKSPETAPAPAGEALASIGRFREACAVHVRRKWTVEEDSAVGQHVVIAGAGPSLADHAAEYCGDADQVWGCNSALPYLVSVGQRVTHALTVDQTPAMVNEWETAPDVPYLVPSTIHPHLTAHLLRHGRSLTWFHNYVGIKGPRQEWPAENGEVYSADFEDWLYYLLYPPTFRAGSGLNTVTRAIDVATWMGFSKITVLGADCALRVTSPKPDGATLGSAAYTRWLRESTIMHADGGHAMASGATMVTMDGEIDGRVWTSKPDLLVSAVWMEKMRRNMPERLFFVGDTLPNALAGKSETFLGRLPTLTDSTGRAIMVPSIAA